ncbi:hypothetical protein HG535_0C03820 [Zygotorulaspora mrakii]|uniref:SED5-binding protein 3 n=1 Tax=Zygotorulaspora mrakii TaxID=42260 RepID=A0A7H9B215_ZYGMR|nr:uncharacterized protein HG535_0C03820 [Zygotorulaspora mrakii]QLG72029.1 hypothetical protein HG535_0C03820 [Zygotorulaspora mrakii]
MAQENLARNISALSLDQQTSGNVSRKSRRPNRAYHDLASGLSAPSTPFSGPPSNQGGFPFNNGSFTPVLSANGSMSAPRLHNESPLVGSTDQFSQSQAYSQPNGECAPAYSSSHYVATQRWEDQLQYLTKTFETSKDSVPPLPTTQFYCADQGACDPRLLSLSMYNVPVDESLRSATKLPLGISIQPFANLIPNEPIPTVTLGGNQGPLRCRRCRSYVNARYKLGFDSTVTCNICKVKTQFSPDEYPVLDPQMGNSQNSPMLTKGCVEFLVPETYNAKQSKEPLPLHYLFLIDLSLLANENGSSLAVVEGVRTCIEYISDFQPNCKVAIMAFDSKIRFFNLRPELDTAQEYVVTDIYDAFLPMLNGLFVRPQESQRVIDDTLRKITNYIASEKFSHVIQVCYGPALQAAKLAIDTITGGQGGKIFCSLNSLPTLGHGNLSLKKDDATKKNLRCENDFYAKLGNEMLHSYVSVDLFVTSSAFVDMATVGFGADITGGTIKYYPSFSHEKDEFTLVNDMLQSVSSIVGYQALLKIRCSTGLVVSQYYLEASGNSDRDPMIPVLTKDTTIDALLKYDQKLKPNTEMSFQAALLYTDLDGKRKVRSINTYATVSGNIRSIFQSINQNVAMRIMTKEVITSLGDCDFINLRKKIDAKMVEILTQYKALIGGSLSSQLVLPEALRTLPAYMLSFEKTELMAPNAHSARGNERIYDLFKFKTMNSAQLSYKLYPQVVPLHVLLEESDLSFYDADEKLLQVLPSSMENLSVRNSHASITNGGCYLIFQGDKVYLWFNENTNRMLLHDLLEVEDSVHISQITLFGGSLPELSTEVNAKALQVIKYWCQATNRASLSIELLRPNVDQYYSRIMAQLLVEDKTINKIDALDNYLVTMHRLIQEKYKKDDYVKVSTVSNNNENDSMHQKFVQF